MYIKRYILLLLLLCSWKVWASDVTVSYETVAGSGNTDIVKVYMKNNTASAIDLAAVNLSVAYNSSISTFSGVTFSLFGDTWGNGSNENVAGDNVALLPTAYGGTSYDSRVWYLAGITLGASPVTLSPGVAKLLVMEVELTHTGTSGSYYMETKSDFFGNDLATATLATVPFTTEELSATFPVEWLEFEANQIRESTCEPHIQWISADFSVP